jgi:simple sugar transport system ATP-binding protein
MPKITHQSHLIEMEKITKSFGDFLAIDQVNFNLTHGEIHALLGENGAGKSSLMNVLAGIYAQDEGQIKLNGNTVDITGPAMAKSLGIGMVHQHYKLVSNFSALDNIALTVPHGAYQSGIRYLRKIIISKMSEIGFDLDIDKQVGKLSVAEQQRVEILKVLLGGAKIIILDEPTAVLTDEESNGFFKTIKLLAESGAAVILVTHKLKEAMNYADRITVMRGGQIIDTITPEDLSEEQLISLIVGEIIIDEPNLSKDIGDRKISLQNLQTTSHDGSIALKNISLNIRRGEIYGIAGVGGNGQAELASALMGLSKLETGAILFNGHGDISSMRPDQRRNCGLVYIPADRQKYALAGQLSLTENYAISGLLRHEFGSWFKVNSFKAFEKASKAFKEYDIMGARNLNQKAASLSGGNAQKLVISREFSSKPSFIIAHSPSRGLDLRATAAVRAKLCMARDNGAAVLLISEDLDEILLLSDTIAVINGGSIVAEFEAPTTRHDIGKAMVN